MSGEPDTSVHVLGVRHHGPGSARSVRAALEKLQPDVVLIEGPPDADALLPVAAHAEMKPPVALLVYAVDRPARAVFYPFAVFSPEWQALQYALERTLPVRFIDLPQTHQMGPEDEGTEEGEAPKPTAAEEAGTPRGDPLGALARAAGYEDGELWWDHLIEQRRDPEGVFDAVLEAMTALREGEGELPPHEARREAHMRRGIRQAKKDGFQRIAVVCGAWHAPALVRQRPAREDDALLKGLPKTKVAATWIPWTYDRLGWRSGYGAGVESPGWYAHLWLTPQRPVTSWAARIAHLLRDEGLDASSANVIETVRLAEALAALRGLSTVGLGELRDAALSVMCGGDATPLALVHEKLEVGTGLGSVPSEVPSVPLARDLAALQKSLRLPPSSESKLQELDLRKDLDRERSRLLHRLRLLDIPWGSPEEDPRNATGTFREVWRLKWEPELAVRVVEASFFGNTVDSAATGRVVARASEATELGTLTALLEASLLAELPAAIDTVLRHVQALSTRSADVPKLLEAFPALAHAIRYGSVRETPTAPILAIADGLFERIVIGLPGACVSLDDEASRQRRDQVRAMHAAVALLEGGERSEEWAEALGQLVHRDSVHGLVRGTALRLRVELGRVGDEELGTLARRALSMAVPPAEAAAWLEGLVSGSALLLLHRQELWAALDGWLSGLARDAFVEHLPLVRRAFAGFSPSERRAMGERVKQLTTAPAAGSATAATEDLDPERVAKVLPVLSTLLGVRIHEAG
ncbi:DUF5682 family protein [Vitiosangium sp. GDMCC 1.1324]|uniref:DUF5682 family protein n=1 Tax=Vitiosangium sp. (strain GDMCC 1.1324) TaxID=2138576 RepID=UPI000D3D21C6|nr:DUF5682 family protein [Vitiosangium sp. GDMCC 1.1324]PTL76936.1 hypothetical protein DAT35_47600 [Vitiosangium sp. GDMCC 1.1324]